MLLNGCNVGVNKERAKEDKLIKSAVAIAEEYASGHLKNHEKKLIQGGDLLLSDGERAIIIESNSVKTGNIDEDTNKDAIVTILHLKGDYITGSEHLIILSANGKPSMIRSVESDMKILNIANGIITVKVPTHPRTSPLFNCESCQEIVNYRFLNGDLVKAE